MNKQITLPYEYIYLTSRFEIVNRYIDITIEIFRQIK